MPIAAVPKYLGQDFKQASPGMRFGHFLPIWTSRKDQEEAVKNRAEKKSHEGQEVSNMLRKMGMDDTIRELVRKERNPLEGLWEFNKFAERTAWKSICELSPDDQRRMQALLARQEAAYQTASPNNTFRLEAIATSPFTTGLGNEHPLENGFAFLNPYGLPYLPGSGVKGVLRQAARELASGEWGETHGWSEQKTIELSINKKTIGISMLDVLFGLESKDGDKEHLRGALSFWDVIPQIAGNSLAVEIMTPHQSHYYQQKCERKSGESTSPHDSGSPNPISFLTVPPGSGFNFFVTCDTALLGRHAPELVEGERWKTLLQAAFEHAFAWLGFGAKTAVGYGAMQIDSQAKAKREADEQNALKAQKRQQMSAAQRKIQDFIEYMQSRYEALRGKPVQPHREEHNQAKSLAKSAAENADWTAEEKFAAAKAIEEWLPKVVELKEKQWKEEYKKLKLSQLKGEAKPG